MRTHPDAMRPRQDGEPAVSVKSPTDFTDPRGMKLCPIHRTSLFLSDGWESVELHDGIAFC
jgi:hypothetical protein